MKTETVNQWIIASDYEVKGGFLSAVGVSGDPVKRYVPVDHAQELVDELAAIGNLIDRGESNANVNEAIVEFARKYGPLGYGAVGAGTEPLRWIRAHALGVLTVLDITCWLKGVARDEQKLARIAQRPYAIRREVPAVLIHGTRGDSVHLARKIRADIIGENIRGVYRVAAETPEGRPRFHFRTPYEVAYWRLADLVDGGEVAACKSCGLPFVRTDRRQRFCPSWLGLGQRKDSACGARERVRRSRKKQKDRQRRARVSRSQRGKD